MSTSVVRTSDCPKPLLASGVPYCQLQFLIPNSEKLDFKIHPYGGGDVIVGGGGGDEADEEAALADGGVADEQHLEGAVVAAPRRRAHGRARDQAAAPGLGLGRDGIESRNGREMECGRAGGWVGGVEILAGAGGKEGEGNKATGEREEARGGGSAGWKRNDDEA